MLDQPVLARGADAVDDEIDVVSAAWIVTALTAARSVVDVEQHLAAARRRLLGARRCVFPHVIGGGQPGTAAHVGSFADQIYPVQALARLQASADDPSALPRRRPGGRHGRRRPGPGRAVVVAL